MGSGGVLEVHSLHSFAHASAEPVETPDQHAAVVGECDRVIVP